MVLPSSQTSPGLTTLSPQRNDRMQAPAGGQVQFGSTLHAPLQPSPGSVLPSSQTSMPPWLLMPSPQPSGMGRLQPATPLQEGRAPPEPPMVNVPPLPVGPGVPPRPALPAEEPPSPVFGEPLVPAV